MTARSLVQNEIFPLVGKVFLTVTLSLVLTPPVVLIWLSLTSGESGSGGQQIGLHWYKVALLDSEVLRAMTNSSFFAAFSSVLATALAFTASIIFVRRAYLSILFLLLGVPLFVPGLEHGLAISNSARYLGLRGSSYLLILADTAYVLPYCCLVLFVSLANFPRILLDVAMELGASQWFAIRKVLFPAAIPGLAASFSIGFLMALNEHARAFYVTSEALLSKYVYGKMLGGTDPRVFAVGSMLYVFAFLVLIAVVFLFTACTMSRHPGTPRP